MLATDPLPMAPVPLVLLLEKVVQGLPNLSGEASQTVLCADKGGVS